MKMDVTVYDAKLFSLSFVHGVRVQIHCRFIPAKKEMGLIAFLRCEGMGGDDHLERICGQNHNFRPAANFDLNRAFQIAR